jgi:hypothetical protein
MGDPESTRTRQSHYYIRRHVEIKVKLLGVLQLFYNSVPEQDNINGGPKTPSIRLGFKSKSVRQLLCE